MSEQVGSMALGVPFRSQIAVSVSQNVRAFLNTLGFRSATPCLVACVLRGYLLKAFLTCESSL